VLDRRKGLAPVLDKLAELARREVEHALERATAFPGVAPEQVFDHVYDRPPPRVIGQRRRALGRPE
jgi:TPP-dependent pyruvate/acetoin dehydrogenase alpha subunit